MDRQYLLNCLNRFFLDSWGASTYERMTSLLALLSYYAMDDLPKELEEDVARLNAAMLQLDLQMACAKADGGVPFASLADRGEWLQQLATVNVVKLSRFVQKRALLSGHMAFIKERDD